jgi:predicted CopG family antitoxin
MRYQPQARKGTRDVQLLHVLQGYIPTVPVMPSGTSHPHIDVHRRSTPATRMAPHVHLDDDVYERIKADKRDDESISDAVERILRGRSLRELRGVVDTQQVSAMRSAIETADRTDREETREVAERFE